MPADEIETRIVFVNERILTASVNGIEHIESQSLDGVGVIRIYFQPGANIAEAEAQVTATCQTLLKVMPPGITPPYIVRYSATSVPIVQIAVSSDTLTEQQIFDYAQNFVIQQLGTVQGARVPQPWGGKQRQIMVDLDPDALYAHGLSPQRRQHGHRQPEPDHPGRHRQDGRPGVQRQAQQQPGRDRGLQRHPDPDRQRRPGLRQGRGPRAGRLRGADQHRPPRRPPGGAHDHPQGRGGLDPQRGRAACARPCPASRPSCRRS